MSDQVNASATAMVELAGVSKSFGDVEVLKNVNLRVSRGEVVAVVGASGSGKSTMLRCINWLERPSSGLVRIDGKPVGYRPSKRVKGDSAALREVRVSELDRQRTDVGMVFQSFNLFPHLSVLDNLTLAPRASRGVTRAQAHATARDLLEQVGLPHKEKSYPRQLSGGEQQRVAIARALALSPKVMLFDEPTSALDPELVGEVLDVMKTLAKEGMTMLVVTHEWGFARELADTIAFMDGGVLVEKSPPSEFFVAPKTARAAEFLEKAVR